MFKALVRINVFISTKANLDGVSVLSYKIVAPSEFAYVADTSRRGDKMALALNLSNKNILISSIYTVFRSIDKNVLLPEYLFLMLNRPEFDRYARFNSWGSARETFDWSEMERVQIPLPPPNVQQAIVDVYHCMERAQYIASQAREKLKTLLPSLSTAGSSLLITDAMKGKFYESEYEEALIDLLQAEGWQYTNGGNIHRQLRESLLVEDLNVNDLHIYLQNRYPNLTDSDVTEVINYLRHVPGQTHFERLRNTFQLVRDGYRYTRHGDGENFDIRFIDFDNTDRNIFRVVNQFEVAYGMKNDVRIPDVLLFVNGIPLCIFELKNPTKLDVDIAQAYEQIHTRYMRDIPHLLRYCPLSCISDATDNNTRLGTTYTPYEHYYAWKKVNNEDPSAQKGIDQVRTIVKGVYEPSRFLEILRDYVYFPDEKGGREEEIVCRYPQFLPLE